MKTKSNKELINTREESDKFRPMNMQFVEGDWYPCIDHCGERSVLVFRDNGLKSEDSEDYPIKLWCNIDWVGESLGKLNFLGDDD